MKGTFLLLLSIALPVPGIQIDDFSIPTAEKNMGRSARGLA